MKVRLPSMHGWNRGTLIVLSCLFGIQLACAADPPARPGNARGKALYREHCVVCHGAEGKADTPVAAMLTPRPRNFTDPVDMGRVSADRMFQSIKQGRPGTAMAPWGPVLSDPEIGDLVDYVDSLDTSGGAASLGSERLSNEIGHRIYVKDCAPCHGETGLPNPDVARVLKPPPRNLSDPFEMARVDEGRAYLAVFRGRPGTAMGGWRDQLTPLEIVDVVRYLRTLAQPLPPGTSAADVDQHVGAAIYQTYCVGCHGPEGNGQTAVGRNLLPHPRDFTRAAEMAMADDRRLAASVTNGIGGTAMAPWDGVLNREDIRRVIAYIRTRFASAEKH